MADRDWVAIVDGLERKAERTTFPGEREALLAKAAELREKFPAVFAAPPGPKVVSLDELRADAARIWEEAEAQQPVVTIFRTSSGTTTGTSSPTVTIEPDGTVLFTYTFGATFRGGSSDTR